jgi:Tol biopolymer transport system component
VHSDDRDLKDFEWRAGCSTGVMTARADAIWISLLLIQACAPGEPHSPDAAAGSPDAAAGMPDTPTAPTLAADQLVFDSTRSSVNHEIFVMKTDGSSASRLTNDAAYENWWPRVSPDRTRVLFYRAPAGKPEDYAQASLWVMNADGSGATQLRAQGQDGWTLQGHGEWSPDGTRIAMFGSVGAALEIFVTDASGESPVQYTSRGGVNTDVSWSPDGSKLLFNGCPGTPCVPSSYEIYVMPAVPLAAATRLTTDTVASYDPYFSPDGHKLAWLVNVDPAANVIPGTATSLGRWAIRIADAAGDHASYLIDDGNINSKPAWSLDGQTIYFHRMIPPDYRFKVFRIGPDGSGLRDLTAGAQGISEHPSN